MSNKRLVPKLPFKALASHHSEMLAEVADRGNPAELLQIRESMRLFGRSSGGAHLSPLLGGKGLQFIHGFFGIGGLASKFPAAKFVDGQPAALKIMPELFEAVLPG